MRLTTRPRRLVLLLTALLLASVAANGVLVWLVRDQYRAALRVRLDPTSEATFAPLNASQAASPAGTRRVVFFGDSRTEMWRPLPAVAGCQVVNRGRSGDTSGQLLLRAERDVIALKPDLVFVEIGANDLKAIGALPDEHERIADHLRHNVLALVDTLIRGRTPVVLSTVYPFGEVSCRRRPVWSDRILQVREEWNRELRSLRRDGVTVFDADAVLATDGRLRPEYRLDELHLNDAAYRALNAALPPVLEGCLSAGRR